MLTKGPKPKHERRVALTPPTPAKRRAPAKPPKLPELMKPDGAGHMPLYCVAQWIATRGGTLEIKPLDEAIWREAFKDLLNRIASRDVKVVGEYRDGILKEIDSAHFASCPVDYPFSGRRTLDNELCLVSCPYLDDEHWRGGFDDRFENWQGVRWRRLTILKADVARCWPFGRSQGTGTPGRPSSMYLVEEEHRRRCQRGEAKTGIGAEARELADWFRVTHPDAPSLTAKTIANRIRHEHRKYVAGHPKEARN
jgi:hypothetical protein